MSTAIAPRTQQPLRLVRALSATTVCTLGSVAAHAWAGGGRADVAMVAAVWVLVAAVAGALSQRRLSPVTLVALTLIAQTTLHLVWMGSSSSSAPHDLGMASGHLGAALATSLAACLSESAWERLGDLLGFGIWRLRHVRLDLVTAREVAAVVILPAAYRRVVGDAWGRAPPVV